VAFSLILITVSVEIIININKYKLIEKRGIEREREREP
jgi:hypothetical protein